MLQLFKQLRVYMRMSEKDIFIIKSTILKYIQNAKIILFGSRTDDNKKGGDIDTLVQTDERIHQSFPPST